MARLPGLILAAGLLPATCLLMAAGPAAAQEPTVLERCLLEGLKSAPADTTLGALRIACGETGFAANPPEAPVSAPEASLRLPEAAGPLSEPSGPMPGSPGPLPESDSVAALAALSASRDGPVRRRIVDESRLWGERFALLPHRPNYLLPVAHARGGVPDRGGEESQRNEVKFQVSFKLPLLPPLFENRVALFFAYTGQAWWQAYNDDRSAPFREYGHEPEIFLAWRPDPEPILGWTPRVASAGFVHHSNGRSGPESRSWNRLFAELTLDRPDGWWLALRPWWRLPERVKADPLSADGDDNPGIQRYYGDGELRLGYVGELHHLTLTARRGLRAGGKGSVQLDWSRPTGFSPQLRWYAQYFDGYGESLVDYRTRLQRFSLGVMLNDWY